MPERFAPSIDQLRHEFGWWKRARLCQLLRTLLELADGLASMPSGCIWAMAPPWVSACTG
jgi:hypothetical protein